MTDQPRQAKQGRCCVNLNAIISVITNFGYHRENLSRKPYILLSIFL